MWRGCGEFAQIARGGIVQFGRSQGVDNPCERSYKSLERGGTRTCAVIAPPPFYPLSSGLIYGWAIDTNAPGTPLNFIVSIDGVIVDFLTANTLRTDLLPVFGAANHGINYTLPTTVRFGTRRLSLNILDSQNGALTTIYDQVIIFS